MKTLNDKTGNLKLQALALAALLPMAAQASDRWEHRDYRSDLSGRVEVSHEIPGGVITVGADWGRPRQPQVVVVENRQPQVIIVEKDRGHGRGRHHRHHTKHVTIVEEQPRHDVVIVREQPRKVVIVNEQPACNRADDSYTQVYRDVNQVSVQKSGPNGTYQYYKDANQVSERRTGPNGTYQYYEDANQVSIQDNRDGRPQRNVYVRK